MATVRALVLRSPGANCDGEAVFALEQAGAVAERLHVQRLLESPHRLEEYQLLVIPGGFSYGDDVAAGKILAHQLRHGLAGELQRFRDRGRLILGICNGFQVLLKAGLLIPPAADGTIPATLTANVGGQFLDRWIVLQGVANCKSPLVAGYGPMLVPIAHGEGRFFCKEAGLLDSLAAQGQIAFRYSGLNPNGSMGDVAGLCDASGQVLGLMPHPERHVLPTQHPRWTREGLAPVGDGLRLFQNAVRALS